MFGKTLLLLLLGTAILVVQGLPAANSDIKDNDLMASIYSDCLKKESLSCIKRKVFSFVDRMLAEKEDISLSEGITVVKTKNIEEGAPR